MHISSICGSAGDLLTTDEGELPRRSIQGVYISVQGMPFRGLVVVPEVILGMVIQIV
jgi:hypothetical protein